MIHGFKGSPDCMRQMGKHLAGAGISAFGIRLKGHGTSIAEMAHCHYRDWILSAEEGLKDLHRHCRKVFVAGISMGGVISFHLAGLNPKRIGGVIAMSTPYDMPVWMKALVPALKPVLKRVAPLRSLGVMDPAVETAGYHQISLPAAHQLFELIDLVKTGLPEVTCPVLIISSLLDRAVAPQNASRLLAALGSKDKELFWVKRSGHMVTLDYDKRAVFQRAVSFIRSHVSSSFNLGR